MVFSGFLLILQELLHSSSTLWKELLLQMKIEGNYFLVDGWQPIISPLLTSFSKMHFPNRMDFVIQVTSWINLFGLHLMMHSFRSFMFLVTIGFVCRMYSVEKRMWLNCMIIVCLAVMPAVRSRNKQQPSYTVKHPISQSGLSMFNVRKEETCVGCSP